MKKIQQKNRLRTTKTHNRVATSQGDGTRIRRLSHWNHQGAVVRIIHTVPTAPDIRSQASCSWSQFFCRVLSERLPADFMVYHGLSWFIIIILGLYNVVSNSSISRYTHHIFRAISGRSNNPIPWRYSVMISGENWDLFNQSGDLTNSARRRSWDILGYIDGWFMVIHPMQWESYENIQPR